MLVSAASRFCNLLLTCIIPVFIFFIAHASVLFFTMLILYIQMFISILVNISSFINIRRIYTQFITIEYLSRIRQSLKSFLLSLILLSINLYTRIYANTHSCLHRSNFSNHVALLFHFCPTIQRKYLLSDLCEDPICTICFDNIPSNAVVHTLNCTHLFHSKCIQDWFIRANRCPLCAEYMVPLSPLPSCST